jgi:hypothetical protein
MPVKGQLLCQLKENNPKSFYILRFDFLANSWIVGSNIENVPFQDSFSIKY